MTSIRGRLVALLFTVIGALTALHAAVTWRIAHAEAVEQFDQQLRQAALVVLRGRFVPGERGPSGAERAAQPDDLIVTIQEGADGAWASHPMLPGAVALPAGFATLPTPDGPLRVFTVQAGSRTVRVAQLEAARTAYATRVALRNLAPIALLATALAALAWLAVVRALEPLEALAARLARRSPDALEPLGDGGEPRELAPLVHATDALLQRVRETLAAREAFVADAAHELRTPVAALRLQLQVARREAPGPRRDAALGRLAASVDRTSRLVAQLLVLARSDAAPLAGLPPVDLATVCTDAVAAILPLADAAGARIDATLAEPPGSVLDRADSALLEAMLRNLVENAVRHAPGGCVRLSLHADDDEVRIVVQDDGPGIGPQDRERVFDRFQRAAGTAGGGSGLGLAIVRSVVSRHRGSVALADGDGPPGRPGLRVSVRLPRAGAATTSPGRSP